MKHISFFTQVVVWGLWVASLGACSHVSLIESDLAIQNAPTWVNSGTFALQNENPDMRYAVGNAPDLGNLSLQLDTATTRARANLAQIIVNSSEYNFKDDAQFDSASKAGSGFQVKKESLTKSEYVLRDSAILGQWRNPKDGEIFILVGVDITRPYTGLRD